MEGITIETSNLTKRCHCVVANNAVFSLNFCFVFLLICVSVPEQTGGAPQAGERPARQSLRAARRLRPRAGAEQPEAGSGQQDSSAKDPGVK